MTTDRGPSASMNGCRSRLLVALVIVVSVLWRVTAQHGALPSAPESVKFAVIGDSGTGEAAQYQVADAMARVHTTFAFDRVIMLGDNIYGRQGPQDRARKFAQPYKALLDAGVKFYAALGNHDSPDSPRYPPFNMGGERYYSHGTKNVRFFALDSNQIDRKQLVWLEGAFKSSPDGWKICYLHHPLYSNGGTHGPSVEVRVLLEPLFLTYGVDVVFSGHDHIYERLVPQKGINYFVEGAGGQLRKGDTRRSATTGQAFDQDQSFMLVEIEGDTLSFETIARTGQTVDSGVIHRQIRGGSSLSAPRRP